MIISGVAHPKANSFVSWAEANDYIGSASLAWMKMDDYKKEALLRNTAYKISQMSYVGIRYYKKMFMAFPRRADYLVERNPLANSSWSLVETGNSIKNYEYVDTGASSIVSLDAFPAVGTVTEPLIVKTYLSGALLTFSITNSSASASVGSYTMTVDYNKGLITFNFVPDPGSIVSVNGFFYSANSLQSTDLIITGDENPDLYAGGCLHLIYPDGTRFYYDVMTHNIATGVITLCDCTTQNEVLESVGFERAIFFYPIFELVKKAQITQIMAELGVIAWDKHVGTGVTGTKIGDTSRSYGTGQYTLMTQKLAARYGLHPSVVAMLGRYLTKGKVAIGWAGNPYEPST